MTAALPLAGRAQVAVVDNGDADVAAAYRWTLWQQARRGRTYAYVVTSVRGPGGWRKLALHTLLTGWARVEHLDGDPLNCRRANLAPVTYAEQWRRWRAAKAAA
jgi:hypothetical protein